MPSGEDRTHGRHFAKNASRAAARWAWVPNTTSSELSAQIALIDRDVQAIRRRIVGDEKL